MSNAVLTPEVTAVLERSTISGNELKLPYGLERKLYEAVNKAIVNAGGKWNKKAQAHVFPSDPREKLSLMLETGVSEDEKKKYQAFYTPPDLADEIALLANVSGHVVLEPSAGEGALADACMKFGAASVRCIELNPESVAKLEAKGYSAPTCADFLTQKPATPYKRIVMNPPFAKNQDIKHIARALAWLSHDGLLVSVLSGNTERPKLKQILNGHDWKIKDLPRGAFKSSGTDVATAILTLRLR